MAGPKESRSGAQAASRLAETEVLPAALVVSETPAVFRRDAQAELPQAARACSGTWDRVTFALDASDDSHAAVGARELTRLRRRANLANEHAVTLSNASDVPPWDDSNSDGSNSDCSQGHSPRMASRLLFAAHRIQAHPRSREVLHGPLPFHAHRLAARVVRELRSDFVTFVEQFELACAMDERSHLALREHDADDCECFEPQGSLGHRHQLAL